jgi:type 1 glutamine amidotransferase
MSKLLCRFLSSAVLLTIAAAASAAAEPDKVHLLIIDGENNHDWRATTPILKRALEKSGRFTVEVATTPQKPKLPPEPKDGSDAEIARYKQDLFKYADAFALYKNEKFAPDLTKYQVVLSNYNGPPWPADFQKALAERLKEGQLGFVLFHAADNAFAGWPEYNQMIGMGWRGSAFGDRLYFDSADKLVRVPKGQGIGAGETSLHPFRVAVRNVEHPITRGMPREWMHMGDQLVHGLRGPIENVEVLATAFSDKGKGGTGEHEPMLWTVSYGKGRVFHTPMGHGVGSVRCIGFQTALLRGAEWAATGKVTLPIPEDFPTAEKTSAVAEK